MSTANPPPRSPEVAPGQRPGGRQDARQAHRVLVIGYGNELRGDDGIGPWVAGELVNRGHPGVRALAVSQLTPELAAELAAVPAAVFVDACPARSGPAVMVAPLVPEASAPALTHAGTPRSLLALAQAVYDRTPAAWLITAEAHDFGFRVGLSPAAAANARAALAEVEAIIHLRTAFPA